MPALIFSVVVAADDYAKGAIRVTPTELVWTRNPATGLEAAYLIGHPSKPGPYVYRVRWPSNYVLPAHTHPDDRNLVVISGTHYHAFGDKFDAQKLEAGPPGTFFTEPANAPHYGATKAEVVILQISGTGPSGQTFLDPSQDPRKK